MRYHQTAESLLGRTQRIRQAVDVLRQGGIIIFPTDTAYGLGCDIRNAFSIQRIRKVKGRTDTKFTIIASSLSQVEKHFPLKAKALALAKQYWPGPLSIVVNKRFAIRVPAHPIARALALTFGRPLIATSANRSKHPECYSISCVKRELGEASVDFWIDGGRLPKQPPSTIVRVKRNGNLEVIRQGAIVIS